MDALQQRVAAIVEAAGGATDNTGGSTPQDAETTFRAIHAAALEAAGRSTDPSQLPPGLAHALAPRLSEPWFC
jgi:hypothetical protein